jgi:hypothetical protein
VKNVYLLLPVLAALGMGGWWWMDRQEADSLRAAATELKVGIAAVDTGRPESSTRKAGAGDSTAELDLRSVSSNLAKLQEAGGMSEMEEMLRFEQRLSKMSAQELLAALVDLAGLGLSAEARGELEKMILGQLTLRDPELALNHYAGNLKDVPYEIGLQLADAFYGWAKNDPVTATAWLDEKLASGNFDSKSLDGRSDIRTQFEAALMENLLVSGPDAAGRRLENAPEDQRRDMLEQIPFANLTLAEQRAYAELVRKWLPANEQPGAFADMGGKMVEGNAFPQVAEFLDSIQASSTERYAAAKQGAESRMDALSREGPITQDAVDTLRTWVRQQAPDQTDRITGKSLADAAQNGGKFSQEEAFALVLADHQRSGNDATLVAFVEGYAARSNLEKVQALVQKITDPAVRAVYTR